MEMFPSDKNPNDMREYTKEEIENALEEIGKMPHSTMCRMWRFGGNEIYFRSDLPTASVFKDRLFKHFGGFSPGISKTIGWV